jgi:hypothetical protein
MQGLIERYMKSTRGAQPDAPIETPPLVCINLSLSYRHDTYTQVLASAFALHPKTVLYSMFKCVCVYIYI